MKFEILNRITGLVQVAAEIECREDTAGSVKLGLAVQWAIRKKADLSDADLTCANMIGADLSDADLSDANLTCANLTYANLRDANLCDANLTCANLTYANLCDANLTCACLTDANLTCANLIGADLSDADLSDANLRGAHLDGANLTGTNLIDAGHDSRGYRFWAWLHKDGHIVYRAGCREWDSYEAAVAHYGEGYSSDGHVPTCLAKLAALRADAEGRGWL